MRDQKNNGDSISLKKLCCSDESKHEDLVDNDAKVGESKADSKSIDKKALSLGYSPYLARVVFPGGKLPKSHPFSFEKAIQSRYEMPTVSVRSYRTIEYHRLCTGGFNRICTERGRVYWLAQNENGHTTPDWKLHFSIAMDQLGLAWNILAALFLDHACDIGMKVCVAEALGTGKWPESQRGREITVYMYVHDKAYDVGGPMADLAEQGEEYKFWLSPEYECRGSFWRDFVREAERRLQAYGVRDRGCADGDMPLGRYASLRNEAFVPWIKEETKSKLSSKQQMSEQKQGCSRLYVPLIYPLNESGWNARGQPAPGILVDTRVEFP